MISVWCSCRDDYSNWLSFFSQLHSFIRKLSLVTYILWWWILSYTDGFYHTHFTWLKCCFLHSVIKLFTILHHKVELYDHFGQIQSHHERLENNNVGENMFDGKKRSTKAAKKSNRSFHQMIYFDSFKFFLQCNKSHTQLTIFKCENSLKKKKNY